MSVKIIQCSLSLSMVLESILNNEEKFVSRKYPLPVPNVYQKSHLVVILEVEYVSSRRDLVNKIRNVENTYLCEKASKCCNTGLVN